MKGLLRDDIGVTPQELLELGDEPAREPWRQVGTRLDEEIQIARGLRIAPSDGPKNAHVASAVMPRDPKDFLASPSDQLFDSHNGWIISPAASRRALSRTRPPQLVRAKEEGEFLLRHAL
jgi:hypothetical protein